MNLGDLNKVWEVRPLKRKPGSEEAGRFLDRIAKQVQPILRSRKWRVKVLSEFYPTNPALLGLNVGGGVEIKLRLRRPNREWDFYPFDQVLDTMLHELSHIEHGPHNASFYKLWDELRAECEELVAKGITGSGQGFDAHGRRLGGVSHQPPLSSLRQTTLAAAEKRARLGVLLPSGPRRLGGDGYIMSALSPVQAAAMAAERRMHDEVWCGSGTPDCYIELDIESGSSDKPASESETSSKATGTTNHLMNNVIIDSCHNEKKRKSSNGGSPVGYAESNLCSSSDRASLPSSSSAQCTSEDTNKKPIWECSVCTLFNQSLAPVCEACGASKPKDASTKFRTWSCTFCTMENHTKLDRCEACGQWRYSSGPPVAMYGPHYGS